MQQNKSYKKPRITKIKLNLGESVLQQCSLTKDGTASKKYTCANCTPGCSAQLS